LLFSLFSFSFFVLFSFRKRKENEESREPAWAGPLRPPVSGADVTRKKYLAGHFFFFLSFSFFL